MTLQLLPKLAAYGEEAELQAVWEAAGKEEWGTILKCAPLALSKIGLCYAAASHKEAALIQLPQNGGQLRYTHVRANLIHCADLGREAFREAETQMRAIQLSARQVCEQRGILSKLVWALDDQNLAEKLANVYVSQLDNFAQNCKDGTDATKKKFDDWSDHASEFYRSCNDSKDDNTHKLHDTELEREEQSAIKSQTEAQLFQVAKEETETAVEVEKCDAEFKTATQKARPYWKAYAYVTGVAAEGLAKRTIDAIPQAVGRLGHLSSQPSHPPPPQAPTEPATATAKTESTPNPVATDILLTTSIMTNFHALTAELPNKHDDDRITEYCRKAAECVHFMEQKLKDAQIASSSGSNFAIKDVLDSYKAAVQAAKELIQLGNDQGDSASTWDLDKAKAAQTRLKRAHRDYQRCSVKAQRSSKANRLTKPLPLSQAGGRVFARRSGAKAARINVAKQNLNNTQSRLRDLREEHRGLDRRLQRTQTLMEELHRKCKTLEGIKEVLKECLDALGQLKTQIQNLQGFFDRLHSLVGVGLLHRVGNFSDEMRAAHPGGALADPDFRAELQTTARNLMVWFAAAFELATLYVDVSVKHIVPNIQMLDQLAALVGGDNRISAKALAVEIQTQLERTQGEIETMANERCNAMEDTLVPEFTQGGEIYLYDQYDQYDEYNEYDHYAQPA